MQYIEQTIDPAAWQLWPRPVDALPRFERSNELLKFIPTFCITADFQFGNQSLYRSL
jgi:hypothetical protein